MVLDAHPDILVAINNSKLFLVCCYQLQLYAIVSFKGVSEKMEVATLAVKYLGTALISLIVGFVICFLSALGYTTYIRFQDKKKEIEVHTTKEKLQSKTSSEA